MLGEGALADSENLHSCGRNDTVSGGTLFKRSAGDCSGGRGSWSDVLHHCGYDMIYETIMMFFDFDILNNLIRLIWTH